MPKISDTGAAKNVNSLEEVGLQAVKGMIPFPVMIAGVNRKLNTGNFENIDIYGGIAIPIMQFPHEDLEAFKEAASAAAELGFKIASRETGERYDKLKNM